MSAKKEIKIQTESDAPKKSSGGSDDIVNVEPDQTGQPEQDGKDEVDSLLEELEEKLKSKEKEAQENYDRLLRVSAEFENYKKRASREMEDFRKYSNQSLIKEMLSVVDNLELAINSTNGHQTIDKGLVDGLAMTHKEILKVFEKFSVKPIIAKGQPFDPTFHEAVMQEESDDCPDNTVINELQKGYLIHDRLLRPSMVVVAKSGQKKDRTES